MPTISASCWYCRGTPNLAMMMMKMNRLSTEREYSVSQPAKNSVPYWWPGEDPDADAEEDGQPDVDAERDRDLLGGGLVRAPADDDDVEEQDRHRDDDRGPPDPGGNVHRTDLSGELDGAPRRRTGLSSSGGLFRPPAADQRHRDRLEEPGSVMTTPLRRNTPLQRRPMLPESPVPRRNRVSRPAGTALECRRCGRCTPCRLRALARGGRGDGRWPACCSRLLRLPSPVLFGVAGRRHGARPDLAHRAGHAAAGVPAGPGAGRRRHRRAGQAADAGPARRPTGPRWSWSPSARWRSAWSRAGCSPCAATSRPPPAPSR